MCNSMLQYLFFFFFRYSAEKACAQSDERCKRKIAIFYARLDVQSHLRINP